MTAKVKIFLGNVVKSIQKIIITVALFLIYVFGFGTTLFFIAIFNRKLWVNNSVNKDTFWRSCEIGVDDYLRQS
jgi:hypothetical protein